MERHSLTRFRLMKYMKTQKNFVKHMLKINMDGIKYRKANASARLMRFQISKKFEKMRILKEN